MLNYAVDAALLARYVPAGTELDDFEGKTYLSLIGFEFNRSRLLGVPVPFHQAFEEVNLRFYVRRSSKRGVVFIREFVPKQLVAVVARLTFNENYSCVPMSHRIETGADGNIKKYGWLVGSNQCSIQIESEGPSFLPADGSIDQFITEHYWGYATQRDGNSLEYEVQHPRCRLWKAKKALFSGNAADVYGAEFVQALTNEPTSAFLAKGSPVAIFNGTRIS